MIQITNTQLHPDISFDDYLRLEGTSFSGMKGFAAKVTYGMKIGSLVHKYLLKPKEYNYEEYDIVRPLASKLVDYVGMDIIKISVAEVPMTANFQFENFRFKWKGIPDLKIREIVTIDFKVIKGDLEYLCNRFNYPEQIRGYMLPDNTDLGLIISIDRDSKKVTVKPISKDQRWWQNTILSRGEVIKSINVC